MRSSTPPKPGEDSILRRLFPLIIIALAILLYGSRETVLLPIQQTQAEEVVQADKAPPIHEASLQEFPAQIVEGMPVQVATLDSARLSESHPVPPLRFEPPVITEGKIQQGSSFFVEMQRAGVVPITIDRLVRASRKTFNLKKVHPGQEFTIYQSHQGELDSLRMALKGNKILNLRRDGDQYQAAIDTIPYLVTYHLTSGTIQQSVFATLQAEGANPKLAGQLALIYGWEIDFFTDIRQGDHFTVLYENRTYENGKVVLGRVLASKLRTRGHNYHAIGYQPAGRSWSYYDNEGNSLQRSLLRAPLTYSRVSSNFSHRRLNPATRHYAAHLGVDYAAPHGTPVKTTGDGTVVAATRNSNNGNYIKIKHNRSYVTYYLHLSRFAQGIRTGAKVRQGQIIGYVGSTGHATGPHLDYRIKVGGSFVNPRTVQLPSKNPVPPNELARFGKIRDACLMKFLEGTSEDEAGRTILVEKPAIHHDNQRNTLFEN
jgi:murein DD-endopeptidase MepM/ murein hydrolase activator NlpD